MTLSILFTLWYYFTFCMGILAHYEHSKICFRLLCWTTYGFRFQFLMLEERDKKTIHGVPIDQYWLSVIFIVKNIFYHCFIAIYTYNATLFYVYMQWVFNFFSPLFLCQYEGGVAGLDLGIYLPQGENHCFLEELHSVHSDTLQYVGCCIFQ